jgi:hypothetical protein
LPGRRQKKVASHSRATDAPLAHRMMHSTKFRKINGLERVTGIEPAYQAWEAGVLPLNYTRDAGADYTVITMSKTI